MSQKQEISDIWYKLDNSAVIYPINATMTTQSLFRLTCELNDYVDEEFLFRALTNILPRFPSFSVQLRSGLFRHYFDHNPYSPVVKQDDGVLFQKINFARNNYYLFRTTYYKKRISIDFFHALCDGTGALEFMKTLIYEYLNVEGHQIKNDASIKEKGQESLPEETEDSFLTHTKEYNLFGGIIGEMVGTNAYQIHDKTFRRLGYGLIEGFLKLSDLKEIARKYDVTITMFIAAVAMLAIAKSYKKKSPSKYPLTAMIPVDLRRFFDSITLKNFTSLARCVIDPNLPDNLSAYCKTIKEQLNEKTKKEVLIEKLSLSSFMTSKWITKYMPLFIKKFVMRLGKMLSLNTKQSMIISNLGQVKMPSGAKPFINRFCFNSNVSIKNPINVGVISYSDNVVVSFTRRIVSTAIEKEFFTILKDEGLFPVVISNFRELNR
ncbi:MAG: hypothetical protein LBF68_01125 [Christensenellaceae bacterium]|jgi:hypothetical protein|nr:hypothetical protein [Christensenellaceae bacterium]